MSCEVCDIINGKHPERLLYEDEKAIAFFADAALAEGHIIVAPKEHVEDVEKIPKEIVSHLFYVASFASTGVYEILGGGNIGTNILMSEGSFNKTFTHLAIDIVPRVENDSIKFKWEPKPADQNELNEIMDNISGQTFVIGKNGGKSSAITSTPNGSLETLSEEDNIDGEKDYLLEKLNRIP